MGFYISHTKGHSDALIGNQSGTMGRQRKSRSGKNQELGRHRKN